MVHMEVPRLSVVVPLGDDRGLAAHSLRAWIRQSLPGPLYEIVAVDDGRRRRPTARARAALRPHDSLVVREGQGEIELYQAGADAARGEFLLFTESHAVPAHDTAEALLSHLERTGAAATTLASAHLPRGGLAPLERRLGEAARAERPEARWWAGVSLRGFALRRSLFVELGGFRTDLERFAETALAIEMDRRGLRADEAKGAVVFHGDCRWPSELEPALLALGRGFRAYVDAGPPDIVEAYTGAPRPLHRSGLEPGLARALCTAIVHSALAGLGGTAVMPDLASLTRWAPMAVAGGAGAQLALRVRARLTLLLCLLPLGDATQRLARFRQAWDQVSTCGEIQHLARLALAPPTVPRTPLHFVPGARETDFVGFHSLEEDDRGGFRWTEPAALWRLALPRGDYRAHLGISFPPNDPQLRLYLNGRALRPAADSDPARALTFAVSREALRADGEQHLVLLSAPFEPRHTGSVDGRTLGVAVRSLDLAPAAD